jgi:hypothetical protein
LPTIRTKIAPPGKAIEIFIFLNPLFTSPPRRIAPFPPRICGKAPQENTGNDAEVAVSGKESVWAGNCFGYEAKSSYLEELT